MTFQEKYAINRTAGAGGFTADEIERSKSAPSYEDVLPVSIFGPKADGALANEIRKRSPVVYSQKKQEYLREIGIIPRPPR
jgi:hypothetical protein